jgi:hypothetical protein
MLHPTLFSILTLISLFWGLPRNPGGSEGLERRKSLMGRADRALFIAVFFVHL